ncbi:pyridoxal phosphate-dependent decarboxylase family protein [Tropicibacter naphthalenivorans]|uniref:L-2,4-diaminobutyrate decarboxylase n=1 Tax=Tropicibacter naphthalenivorans TaxID=441103 RepID=A0A0P1G3P0_9RHOB|nr:pyridoxal-dependent decarboxylase [Tropicibacter naphthalenivorans]CUH76335.1 L-2,4-diaminobutyrate decarboxylase [Tropicibacter naphthalenivorans]SMC67776.1 aromatic-L-amino-acid decarboxylase [Tropicibacter naphthalenivorans]
MDWDEFSKWGKQIADWGADYHKTLRDRPVRAQTKPGEIAAQLPEAPPEAPEAMDAIMADFERVVMPGLTHWQHPRFFAYFPANAAPPSMLAEMLVTVLAPQCMLWQTSPAATEMEQRMLDWLRQAIGLPADFSGVIQDSASSATLAAVLVMRERALDWQGNTRGLAGGAAPRVYCSGQVHTSIDRAIWVSGIGQENLVKIASLDAPRRPLDVDALRAQIMADRAAGHIPAGIIGATGGTSIGGCDDIAALAEVAAEEGLYLHVDAAWAGAAMICPEYRDLWAGVERADSVVFNPHKWLGAQFDCSAHFIRDPDALRQTLAIRPEYLKTHAQQEVTDFSEWSVPLGRRFRALKLWFLIRAYGLDGLRAMIRNHVAWSGQVCEGLRAAGFEIVSEPVLSLFSFRTSGDDARNLALVEAINADGRIYLTQTLVDGRTAIRFQAGAFGMTEADAAIALDVIQEINRSLP